MSMPSPSKETIEVITSVERRRGRSASEKARIVNETYQPGTSVSAVARRHGIAPNQLFQWRRGYVDRVGPVRRHVPPSGSTAPSPLR